MNGVKVRDNENIENALRRFKRVCEKSGVLSDVKNSLFYEKPSEERRRKLKAAKRKILRDGWISKKRDYENSRY